MWTFQSDIETPKNSKKAIEILSVYWYDWFQYMIERGDNSEISDDRIRFDFERAPRKSSCHTKYTDNRSDRTWFYCNPENARIRE